ncbi:MAG: CotH kinase family protein, partial [Desulfobulbaceae bacterium]|nr:CotH kinase family protein [Desulfobulbaceae bacterium]
MKVSPQAPILEKRGKQSRKSFFYGLFLFVLSLILVSIPLLTVRPDFKAVQRWMVDQGFILKIFYKNPGPYLRAITRNISNGTFSEPDLPVLMLDIKFKNWQKIVRKRNEALREGKLLGGDDDYVKAVIRHGEQSTKVKLRLKGDWTDHFDGEKWSFRVKVKGKNSLLGMRVFSLQHPKTRGFHGEPLFFSMLQDFNVLTPRYFFVREILNGKDMGIMALEEHFSKELLERNGRRESVIIKFDESLYWEYIDDPALSFNDYTASRVDSFQTSKVNRSKKLSADYNTAVGLLRGFINRDLTASEVFDVEQMGALLAASDIWGSYHVLRWHNLRFYYNPVTARLEPIAFDANIQDQEDVPTTGDAPIIHHIMEDNLIHLSYLHTIREVKKRLVEENYLEELTQRARVFSRQLGGEYPLIPPPLFSDLVGRITQIEKRMQNGSSHLLTIQECSTDRVRGWAVDGQQPGVQVKVNVHLDNYESISVTADRRVPVFHTAGLQTLGLTDDKHGFLIEQPGIGQRLAQWCTSVSSPPSTAPINGIALQTDKKGRRYKIAAYVDKVLSNGTPHLEFNNIIEDFLEVRAVDLVVSSKNGPTLLPVPVAGLPLILPPKYRELPYTPLLLPLLGEIPELAVIEVTLAVAGEEENFTVKVGSLPPALDSRPVPQSNLDQQLAKHAFLQLTDTSSILTVLPGSWQVEGLLVVPPGYSLTLNKGTELLFEKQGGLISHGPLFFNGSEDEPIILSPCDGEPSWLGVAVLGTPSQPHSSWNHVVVSNTAGVTLPGWSLSGGVNFYRTKVSFKHCLFENNEAEDALNLIHSQLTMQDVSFYNTRSDGLDCDFSNGTITGGEYRYIGSGGGGDAIDISGSTIEVK